MAQSTGAAGNGSSAGAPPLKAQTAREKERIQEIKAALMRSPNFEGASRRLEREAEKREGRVEEEPVSLGFRV